ncbi:hypothetical protein TWF694_010117 [Orbilia ellipsospora]|uniref:Uncharacterized protein n=1 Tax=Orbilia ellipsospora TaxID=2528407 RepID=A0AAV9X8X3_9PEZI
MPCSVDFYRFRSFQRRMDMFPVTFMIPSTGKDAARRINRLWDNHRKAAVLDDFVAAAFIPRIPVSDPASPSSPPGLIHRIREAQASDAREER